MRTMGLCFVMALSLASGCGGGSSPISLQITPISVVIAPTSAALGTGGTQAFSATVQGTTNQAVTWSVVESTGGSISTVGLYTAPVLAGTYHVVATSQADPAKTAVAAVTVTVHAAGAVVGVTP